MSDNDTVKRFMSYAMENWITIVVLVLSATQTFTLVDYFAPEWAIWLPFVGVAMMEGGFLYWKWREMEADAADGSIDDVEKNEQEKKANFMVYVTLGMSVVTMLAGALLEVGQSALSQYLSAPGMTAFMGWIAITGIFVLAGLHLFMDWQYHRTDPDVKMAREHRAAMRKAGRQQLMAQQQAEITIASKTAQRTKDLTDEKADVLADQRATKQWQKAYASDVPVIEEMENSKNA